MNTRVSTGGTEMLRIVRGDPSDEEVAALTVVVAGLASAGTASDHAAGRGAERSAWADPVHRMRAPLHPGPGAWRHSALPCT